MDRMAQELVDAVVEEVGLQSPATLFALSCVARRFRVPSQRCIFRNLTLSVNSYIWDASDATLQGSPHIFEYVQELHIDLDLADTCVHRPLPATLRLLSRVMNLTITGCYYNHNWEWGSLPEDFRDAFISLFTLPTLRTLALKYCDGVPAALVHRALASYKEVTFVDIGTITSDEMRFPRSSTEFGHKFIDHVILDYFPKSTPTFHDLMCNTLPKYSVQHLEINVRRVQTIDERLVANLADSIQQLTLAYNRALPADPGTACAYANSLAPYGLYPDPVDAFGAFNIPTLPHLRHLYIVHFRMQALDLPDCLTHLLQDLPVRAAALENMTIAIDAEYEGSAKLLDGHHCPELDHALTHLPCLRDAHFSVCCDDATEFDDYICDSLPLADEAGRLSFSRRQKPSE
ncbi:hypothetical protein DFH06DRAFT_1345433 [Mycena polygramma]|nr:hypothetical protein DFH06DRAFT_1345433 [Mycena polygramma]